MSLTWHWHQAVPFPCWILPDVAISNHHGTCVLLTLFFQEPPVSPLNTVSTAANCFSLHCGLLGIRIEAFPPFLLCASGQLHLFVYMSLLKTRAGLDTLAHVRLPWRIHSETRVTSIRVSVLRVKRIPTEQTTNYT
jgi:hypothetical protein